MLPEVKRGNWGPVHPSRSRTRFCGLHGTVVVQAHSALRMNRTACRVATTQRNPATIPMLFQGDQKVK